MIPNEKYNTYEKLFNILKNDYKFQPKIFTVDFCRATSKALKQIFPSSLIIKCFFHWVKSLWNNLKKNGFNEKEKINKTKILMFNMKIMAFIEPKLIKNYYSLR